MLVDLYVREQQAMDFFSAVIMDYGQVFWPEVIIKTP